MQVYGPYKVLFLGEAYSGKTWLIHRIANGRVPDIKHPTIGCEHFYKIRKTLSGDSVKITFLDTGQIFFYLLFNIF